MVIWYLVRDWFVNHRAKSYNVGILTEFMQRKSESREHAIKIDYNYFPNGAVMRL